MSMPESYRLPLFPLNTVLFPGITLPLHIFEPRYRLMIGQCVHRKSPFGVVLIREGVEAGGRVVPHEFGTSAYVTRIGRLPDGQIDIRAVGYERFKVQEVTQKRPFLVALVEDYPLAAIESEQTRQLARKLARALRAYLGILTNSTDIKVSLDQIPQQGPALAYFTAAVLPLPMSERQSLLTIDNLPDMLEIEYTLLKREMMLLNYMTRWGREERGDQPPAFFSPN